MQQLIVKIKIKIILKNILTLKNRSAILISSKEDKQKMSKNKRVYTIDPKLVDKMNNTIRSKCPYCGHTMLRSIRFEYILCDHCWRKYENNSKAYKLKKIKEMLKSG